MAEEKKLVIEIDDGTLPVEIQNKNGDVIGVFRFRPTDYGIIERYNKIAADFDKIVEPLQTEVDNNPDGEIDENDDAMAEATRRLYEACDYLFGGNYSEAFFSKMHPFSPWNGKFYCEYAFDAIGNFISQQFDKETKKISNRAEKYTHGYRTGKHKDGKQ